jgi:hypothetical protein
LRDSSNRYKEDNKYGRHSKNRHTLRFLEERNGKAKQQNRKHNDYVAERKIKKKREMEIKQAKHILNIFSLKFHVFHNNSVSYMNKPSFLSLQSRFAIELTKNLVFVYLQVERRLTQLRDNMQQWDAVDRMRVDLRAWLHDMQEEVDDLEKQPSKLHAEACEVDIGKLQGIREEVQARGPAVEGLLARYRELTEHNPDLQDPVVVAVKEDWEELLGQIENLIEDREQALQAAKELQARENEMDDDLENYINALEKIESADVATVQKSAMMKVGDNVPKKLLIFLRH